MLEERNELILEYCRRCGCELTFSVHGFGYVLRDKKRKIEVLDRNDIILEATKLNKIHKLEEQLETEKDFKKRRLIQSHFYFTDNMPK